MVKYYIAVIFALTIFGVPAVASRYGAEVQYVADIFNKATDQLATVILSHNTKTVDDIKSNYTQIAPGKVRILIVPGHEPNYGGAEYSDLKERNMTVELAQDLESFLNNNTHYQVYLTRDTSSWSNVFDSYFKNNWQNIIDWEKASVQEAAHNIRIGSTTKPVSNIYHNSVPNDVAARLYGITKWANENNIDITIHIHFNDDPTRTSSGPGDHTGFSIYIPEHQYANSTSTKAIAETIFKRLSKYNPVSDLKGESSGIVEDPDLIAIGANNTADAASMLIEYGYIYEQQFTNPETRDLAIKDLAYQTYLGIEDFFNKDKPNTVANAYDSVALPHSWIRVISDKNTQNVDVFAMQTALFVEGQYPPADKSLNQCPRSGKFGACTKEALALFQKKYGIKNEKNVVGEKTLQILNKNYGLNGSNSL